MESLCIDTDYEETLEKEPKKDWAAASGEKDLLQDVHDSTTAKDKADSAKGFKSYCPRCRVDSHTEASCTASLFKQASKRKYSECEDSKPSKLGKKKNFKRFKSDLAQVVIEGKCADEFQYIMETDVTHLYACYLITCFGGITEALRTEGHQMTGNQEVMDHWARFSGGGGLLLESWRQQVQRCRDNLQCFSSS